MTFKPRKKLQRLGEYRLTPDELETHLDGEPLLVPFAAPFRDDDELRESWEMAREVVLGLMGQRAKGESFGLPAYRVYLEPGTRPVSWWRFDAPGPRLLLEGDPGGAVPGEMRRGIPKLFRSREAWEAMKYESEYEYLKRQGLLFPGEEEAIEKGVDDGKAEITREDTE